MNVCTVIARNYLAHARVLAESFRRHHPDGRCFVLVIDDEEGLVADTEPFTVLRPRDIDVQAFEQMRSAYSVMELCTAVKPWLLRHMLARHDDGSGVAYLDPDIVIYSRMTELEAALRDHAVVLTPHVLHGMPRDGRRPNETDILLAGVYNLGFIGVADRPDAVTVLDWWAERLLTDCFVAPERGYFVDQRWIDFVPGLIDDLRILRDPAYNVAYWNVPERPLEVHEGDYRVAGRPLRFFHFSGYSPGRRTDLSRHQTRVTLTEHPALLALCDEYRDTLEARGYHDVSTLPYAYDVLPSGVRIAEPMRTLYREGIESGALVEPLFTADGETAFLEWLAGPADGAPGLNRFLHGFWAQRVDLRRAFPEVSVGGLDRFRGWLAGGGREQITAPEALVVIPEAPADSGPPAVPADAVPQAAPPAPDREEQDAPTGGDDTVPVLRRPDGVNVVGYLRSELGVGEIARQLIGALDAAAVPTAAVSLTAPHSRQGHPYASAADASNPFGVNLVCVNADVLRDVAAGLGPQFFADRHTVGVWWWETSHFPAAYHPSFDLVDEIWVGSRFIADSLRQVSPVPVVHMPMPVVFPQAPPFAPGERGWPDAFTFLFSWDYQSVFERKNPLAVVQAYVAAFAPHDGAALVLKSINHADDPENHQRLLDAVAGRPDITVIDEYLDPADKDRLMRSCDCYVSLHRSEGLGLTIAEALFHGRPVIATGYSGNVDLMDAENSHPVSYRMTAIGDRAAPYPPDGLWAEPDVAEASRLMRRVFVRPDASAPLAAKAALDMRARFSAEAVGSAMQQRLAAIAAARQPAAPDVPGAQLVARPAIEPLLDRRGRPAAPSRFGRPGAVLRDLVLRVIRPYTAYQVQVNEALAQAVSSLTQDVERLERRRAVAAAQSDIDRAVADAALAAELRRQKRVAEHAPPAELLTAPPVAAPVGILDGRPLTAAETDERRRTLDAVRSGGDDRAA